MGDDQANHLRQSLAELTQAPGPSGHEGPVRKVMARQLEGLSDEVMADRLGAVIARKEGLLSGPRVMVAGHLDEVGLLVTRITDEGFLRFQPLGGWWSQVLPAQRVDVVTDKGTVLGVVGSTAPHLLSLEQRKKAVPLEELFIDVGAESGEQARQWGIRPGDVIVPHSPFTVLTNSKLWLAKAMDNRLGCAVAVEVLRRLQGIDHPNTLFSVGTVLEEVGRRGAHTATAVVKPDIGFAIDVGISADTPGGGKSDASCKLGNGPLIVLYDAGHIPHRGLIRLVEETAEEAGISLQYEWIRRGATDASHIHLYGAGVPTVSLGVPARYIHSHASIIHQDDAEQLVDLLVRVIQRLDSTTLENLVQS